MVVCYYCNTDVPSGQAKRCSRCRLVVYCSKTCQRISWKATHRNNCVAHPSLIALGENEKPEMFSDDWIELEVDRQLSKWMAEWRSCLMTWTAIALDLANHPPDRVVTHCLHLLVEPSHFEPESYRNYRVIQAEVLPLSQVKQTYPELITHVDPTDFTRLRFVVSLQTEKGFLRRVRIVQWNVRSLNLWTEMSKENSANLAEGAPQALMFAMENMTLGDVQNLLGGRRSTERSETPV